MKCAVRRCFVAVGTIAVIVAPNLLCGQQDLPNLQEAVEISEKTGRPILAMAGRKT